MWGVWIETNHNINIRQGLSQLLLAIHEYNLRGTDAIMTNISLGIV